MSPTTDWIGFSAAVCVLLTFCSTSMPVLRSFSICSNILFIIYASQANLAPVLVLHSLLLPVNIFQLTRMWLKWKAETAPSRKSDLTNEWAGNRLAPNLPIAIAVRIMIWLVAPIVLILTTADAVLC